ncbi:MAG: hypothetical protein K2X47_20730, partial [Bdellovibrionales bacterium]|nr:hypothetical protein [Bdellovibrionales bacterium]
MSLGFRSSLLALLFLLPLAAKARTAEEFLYLEQFSENDYLVEVRKLGPDAWPDLKQTLVLNSQKTSEKKELDNFIVKSLGTLRST